MLQKNKARITITLDPELLGEVDAYISEHSGTDRSKIMDEALHCWYAKSLHDALVKQHAASKSQEELDERAAWKRIRAAQLVRLDGRRDQSAGG